MAAIQDLYPDNYAHCYGCGRLNTHGLHVRSEWRDGECVASFTSAEYHLAMPGFVYGGLLASLIDCHAMATAAAVSMSALGQQPGHDTSPRFVTASLTVDYVRPTPIGKTLELRAHPAQSSERKVVVTVQVLVDGEECARGRVIAVQLPEQMAAVLERTGT
jgi:acyl-coenzyme A thioesterase PaaI-like protein